MNLIQIIKILVTRVINIITNLNNNYSYLLVFSYLQFILSFMKMAKKKLITLILKKELANKYRKYILRTFINEKILKVILKYTTAKDLKICLKLLYNFNNKND